MPLYVVMTNLPGPGAAALIDEASTPGMNDIRVEDAKQAASGACEFVELENEHGAGVGPSSGVTWHTESSFLSDKTIVKLGPFVAEREHREALKPFQDLLSVAQELWPELPPGPRAKLAAAVRAAGGEA